jgi:membrane-bound metal-dependent hydrolase YbcI (DUF457 family)
LLGHRAEPSHSGGYHLGEVTAISRLVLATQIHDALIMPSVAHNLRKIRFPGLTIHRAFGVGIGASQQIGTAIVQISTSIDAQRWQCEQVRLDHFGARVLRQ